MDQPLSAFYGHSTWDDVSSDELIILMPALTRGAAGRTRGAAFFARRMLTARIFDCVTRMAGETGRPTPAPISRQAAIDIVVRSQTVTTVSPIDAALSGDDLWKEAFGRTRSSASAAASPASSLGRADAWALELSILATLNRLVHDAERPRQGSATGAAVQPSDALLASIYASINAAYVYPELDFMHETLMLGAWLGLFERGRAALMPGFIAEQILPHLATKAALDLATDEGKCRALIRAHVDYAGGKASLLKLAKQVLHSGRPSLIRPSRCVLSPELLEAVTSEALKQRLEANGVLETPPQRPPTSTN